MPKEDAVDAKEYQPKSSSVASGPRLDLTAHSAIRSQQRGVPPLVIDLLDQFGARRPNARGTEILFFDRRARTRVLAYAGGLIGRLSEYLDAYAIVADGTLITVGCRYKRIRQE
ncbi:hypothetical protein LMG23992_02233 [Cupriavidus laharis]|uniref:DUF4258 domain-containing protein n=1 Tax=Cupriavidus laharis TaxID=151654 RepID=A0ABN7YI30_9BURK|nr:hypothetical protein [Cupriavidus laharis]CAG9172439.1 hypothetical protein LMG23992_02233 [Cupriavidus laharis]